MQKVQNPIKRSQQLSSLSREHHDSLLFVWKIKQGVAYGIPAERIGNYCSWYWNAHLKPHMKQEENTLTRILSPESPLMNTMLEDHEAIRLKMEQVIDDPSYHFLKRLAQIIYYHVRFEERTLFPVIERVATTDQLDKIARELVEPTVSGQEWHDEFWVKSKPVTSFS